MMSETTVDTFTETITDTLSDSTSVSTTLENILQAGIAGITVERLLTAVIAAVICLVVIRILLTIVDRTLARFSLDQTIKRLIRGGLKALFIFVGLIVTLGSLDIPVTSLVAVLSVAGLALSLALQNFLSNVAGGIQLVVSHPFKIGDWIEVGDCSGTVTEMTLFYIKLASNDNKLIQLPNTTVVSENIINYSSEEKRQIEIKISASYDAPTDKVISVLLKMVRAEPLALTDPAPFIHVYSYGDNSITYIMRVWCFNRDYWDIYYNLMDNFKKTFDEEGIELTYPHLNVHMIEKQS